eukprot:878911-Pyramimonas_sp.AAC.1
MALVCVLLVSHEHASEHDGTVRAKGPQDLRSLWFGFEVQQVPPLMIGLLRTPHFGILKDPDEDPELAELCQKHGPTVRMRLATHELVHE